MPAISVTRRFSVEPLLDVTDPEFAREYGLGVWWALYSEQQGNGPYDDQYIIENINHNLCAGRFDSLSSSWFAHIGFNLGMLHGGWLVQPSETLVGRLHRTLPL